MPIIPTRFSSHGADLGNLNERVISATHPDTALTVLFSTTQGDLPQREAALRASLRGPVLACTTAGEIGPRGFQESSVVGVSLRGDLDVALFPIPDLHNIRHTTASALAAPIRRHITQRAAGWSSFGIVLIDGLSGAEERLMAALSAAVPELSLVGASAGDALEFTRTGVWWDGAFREDMAVLAVINTPQPWATIKTQHIHPTETLLVITEADSTRRTVLEIDAEPAAVAYARAVGVSVDQLGPQVFSQHPLVLLVGGERYIRSIQRAEPDGSLVLYCAIEEGLVLALGRGGDLVAELAESLNTAITEIGPEPVVLGFDCILRRLEVQARGLTRDVGDLFARSEVVGFHTYGEQHGSLHINQTFTGIVVGTR